MVFTIKIQFIYKYSITCVKRPLKNIDKIKILMTNGSLVKVKSFAECSPWSNLQTSDLHSAIIGLENQFSVFLRDIFPNFQINKE